MFIKGKARMRFAQIAASPKRHFYLMGDCRTSSRLAVGGLQSVDDTLRPLEQRFALNLNMKENNVIVLYIFLFHHLNPLLTLSKMVFEDPNKSKNKPLQRPQRKPFTFWGFFLKDNYEQFEYHLIGRLTIDLPT